MFQASLLLLLLLSRFGRVRLCDPIDGLLPPLSLGFSRQELGGGDLKTKFFSLVHTIREPWNHYPSV